MHFNTLINTSMIFMPVFLIIVVVFIGGVTSLLFGIIKKQLPYIIGGIVGVLLAILPLFMLFLTVVFDTM